MNQPYYHQETISLQPPRTGQQILDAVTRLVPEVDSAKLYIRKLPGKNIPRVVWLSNPYEFKQVQILTGENLDEPKLVLEETYEEIAVGSTTGLTEELYPMWSSEDTLIQSVQDIAERLMKILN